MRLIPRLYRHTRLTWDNYRGVPSPPFLILFINSICNQTCEHCFYWRNLNRRDDLTKDEIFALSRSLGRVENLSLSGGEPFLRKEFGEICRQFIRHNGTRQIYVPTNGSFTDRTIQQIKITLEEKDLQLFVAELSLDGMPEFHDKFRGMQNAFQRAMETYEALAELQKSDPRLRIHSNAVATDVNMDEIRQLTTYLFENCPKIDHHNLAMIRGDRKNPALLGPKLKEYEELYEYIRRLWATRESGRYGASVEPILQWTKVRTADAQKQVVPCRAGIMTGVVYSNGDVSFCEAARAGRQPAQHEFPRALAFGTGQRAAALDPGRGLHLHQRSLPLAQHRLSASPPDSRDVGRQAMARGQTARQRRAGVCAG